MQNGDSSKENQRLRKEFKAVQIERERDAAKSAPPPQHTPPSAKQLEARFTVNLSLLIAFFVLIITLHALGIYLFTSGFLLTRLVLEHKSQCSEPPISLDSRHSLGTVQAGCWHPKQFDKAVILVVDALRYDFAVPFEAQGRNNKPGHYHNALEVLYEIAVQQPRHALLLPFIADPPTTTLQRLKGLTTGTLPTFIDAGSNFAGTAIDEDNLLFQLRNASKRVVHLGDDTWHALFPDYFEPELTKSYDSFNVWDLHTVDNGVNEHLMPLLAPANTTKWDIMIGHYLGVDHAGHRYGPNHPAMNAKLKQMDETLRTVIDLLDDKTLLVVMGDHGMDSKGDHGGESDDEVEAAIWMYSKKGIFGRRNGESVLPPATAKQNAVAQIDLVPTLALLLGLPIPFNNLGAPIVEAFLGPKGIDYESLARVLRVTTAQIARYMSEYALVRNVDDAFSTAGGMWKQANELMALVNPKARTAKDWSIFYDAFSMYQIENIRTCRALWAQFDVPSMVSGVAILSISLVLLIMYARGIHALRLALSPGFVKRGGIGLIAGSAAGAVFGVVLPTIPILFASTLSGALGCCVGLTNVFYEARQSISNPVPTRIWSWISVLFTVALSAGFAANSFTIWEDQILLFFLATIGTLFFLSSMQIDSVVKRTWACYHSAIFTILLRVASLSRLCREEQMPYCVSTYYASSNSSTSAIWQLAIPYLVALVLPSIVKQYYVNTRSFHHSAILWFGVAFRMSLALAAAYWTLDTADDGDFFGASYGPTLKTIKVIVAQVVLGLSLPVGYSIYSWAAPFLDIRTTQVDPLNPDAPQAGILTQDGQSRLQLLGYGNAHGSRFFVLPTMYAAAIMLLQKPMGTGAIAIMLWQALSLLEILSANQLQDSAIGPTTLALLGSFHFFKTGHQATLASIQWDSAFIPLTSIRYPWSPIFIIFNTFGAQILAAVAVPAIPLWKRDPSRKGLLGDVAKSVATFLTFFAAEALATSAWAGWLRRHLMLFRIFSPRFMMGALTLLVVDVVAVFVGLGGTRWSFLSIGEVFGIYG